MPKNRLSGHARPPIAHPFIFLTPLHPHQNRPIQKSRNRINIDLCFPEQFATAVARIILARVGFESPESITAASCVLRQLPSIVLPAFTRCLQDPTCGANVTVLISTEPQSTTTLVSGLVISCAGGAPSIQEMKRCTC